MEDVPLVFEGRGLTVTERLAGFLFGKNMSFIRHTDGESLSLVPTTDHVRITVTVCHAFVADARNGVRCETLVWFFGVCDASSCKIQKDIDVIFYYLIYFVLVYFDFYYTYIFSWNFS